SIWETIRSIGSGTKDFVADGADAMGDAMELIAAINDPEKRAKLLSEEGAIKGWGMIAAAIIGAWKFGPIKGGLLGMATGKLLGDLIEWVVGFFKGKMSEEVRSQFSRSA